MPATDPIESAAVPLGECKNPADSQGDRFEWAALEAEKSPRFRARIDGLRSLAEGTNRGGYSLSTGPLTAYGWPELLALEASATGDGRRHVKEYVTSCRALAQKNLLAKDHPLEPVAERVHELVRSEGYRVHVTELRAAKAAPRGTVASGVAAWITGASWGSGATALREQNRYHRSDLRAEDYEQAYRDALEALRRDGAQPQAQPPAAEQGSTGPHEQPD